MNAKKNQGESEQQDAVSAGISKFSNTGTLICIFPATFLRISLRFREFFGSKHR